jgi:hypothetical protein
MWLAQAGYDKSSTLADVDRSQTSSKLLAKELLIGKRTALRLLMKLEASGGDKVEANGHTEG